MEGSVKKLDTDYDVKCLSWFCCLNHISTIDVQLLLNDIGSDVTYGGESSIGVVDNCFDGEVSSHLVFPTPFSVHQELKSSAWANVFKGVNQVIEGGAEEFRHLLILYSLQTGYNYRFLKNHEERVSVVCSKGCGWMIRATLKGCVFSIKNMIGDHNCVPSYQNFNNPKIPSKLVKNLILKSVAVKPSITPKDIMDRFKTDYGLEIGYHTAYHAKDLAIKDIHGDDDLSYYRLRWYVDALKESNPGSYVILEVDEETNVFKRIFIAIGACLNGFRFCHPMLSLDGTFLKTKYKNTCLAATAKDANRGMFPVAYAVVDKENDDNWAWFLIHLKTAIGEEREITFLSDRHYGLVHNIPQVFPNSKHGFCFYHLKTNLSAALGRHIHRADILYRFKECAYAYTHSDFQRKLDQLLHIGGNIVNEFLSRAPFENWANAYFEGNKNGDMCSNISESFNNWILEERKLPITAMLDRIRIRLMDRMASRLSDSKKWTTSICPTIEKRLQKQVLKSRTMRVARANEFLFEVDDNGSHYRVCLLNSKCSCNEWKVANFPCAHVVCAIRAKGESLYVYINSCWSVNQFQLQYGYAIQPIPNEDLPQFVDEENDLEPPEVSVPPGRPRVNRIASIGERTTRLIHCNNCNRLGHHNRRTCPHPYNEN